MMEEFSYALSDMGNSAPLAPRDERASLLVIADRMEASDLAPVAMAAGFRLLGVTPLADAPVRLDLQAQCDSILIFCPSMSPDGKPSNWPLPACAARTANFSANPIAPNWQQLSSRQASIGLPRAMFMKSIAKACDSRN
jgi:hypothetical protein